MENEGDQASDTAQFFQEVSIRNALSKSVVGPVATGSCLNCTEPVEKPKRWCDADCRDDWQRIENSNRRQRNQAQLTSEQIGAE